MQEIPIELRDYLSSKNILYREQLFQRYPDLRQMIDASDTQTLILNWLANDQAWYESEATFSMRCLEFLCSRATEQGAQVIKTFLLHDNPFVRLRAYEYLLTLYFPEKNRDAMFLLLHSMLLDPDDAVRATGAGYIERANATSELRDFLQRWSKVATNRRWSNTESFELVERLLRK